MAGGVFIFPHGRLKGAGGGSRPHSAVRRNADEAAASRARPAAGPREPPPAPYKRPCGKIRKSSRQNNLIKFHIAASF